MDKKTVTLQLFMKNGGPQPETWDPEAINKYFIGNFAKNGQCAMGIFPPTLATKMALYGSNWSQIPELRAFIGLAYVII